LIATVAVTSCGTNLAEEQLRRELRRELRLWRAAQRGRLVTYVQELEVSELEEADWWRDYAAAKQAATSEALAAKEAKERAEEARVAQRFLHIRGAADAAEKVRVVRAKERWPQRDSNPQPSAFIRSGGRSAIRTLSLLPSKEQRSGGRSAIQTLSLPPS
jgi:hypothetical protein